MKKKQNRSFDSDDANTVTTTTGTANSHHRHQFQQHQQDDDEEEAATVALAEVEPQDELEIEAEEESSDGNDDDDDDYEDNEEEEDAYYEDDDCGLVRHDLHRPKLDEGYYEIEAVRRKRLRKGQLQYFIKWRGWPETANTWEPLSNLQSCSDVIDAFEESLQCGKSRSARKRKRRSGATHIQPRKKLHSSSTASIMGPHRMVNLKLTDKPMASAPIKDSSFINSPVAYGPEERPVNTNEMSEQAIKIISTNGSSGIQERKECNELDMRINELKGTTTADEIAEDKFGIHIREGKTSKGDKNADEPVKVDCLEPVQNNRCVGARKRKSGSVKRFRQESALSKPCDSQNEITGISVGSNCRADLLDIGNKFDGFNNACDIVKIIRPISYSSSVTNNFQDVLVTFIALRSDGKEVMIDNKFLKDNNPLLLINFYEQHLRYNPTS